MSGRNRLRHRHLGTAIVIATIAAALVLNLLVSLYTVSEGIEEAQRDTVSQISRTLEIALAQIEDSVFSASLDSSLHRLAEEYFPAPEDQSRSLFGALRTIQLRNRFIKEVGFYLPQSETVLIGTIGVKQDLAEYADAEVIIEHAGTAARTLRPRRTTIYGQDGLYMTLISPVPLTAREPVGYVIAYIDAQRMFHDVVRRFQTSSLERITVHVVEDGRVILSTDESRVLRELDSGELDPMTPFRRLLATIVGRPVRSYTVSTASRLRWDIVLEASVDTGGGSARAVRFMSVTILVLVLLAYFITHRWLRYSQVHEEAYLRSQWAQYLSDPSGSIGTAHELPGTTFHPENHACGVIALKTTNEGLSQSKVMARIEYLVAGRSGLESHLLVPTSPSRIDIVVAMPHFIGGVTVEELSRDLNRQVAEFIDGPCFTASSSLMRSLDALPIAHRECTEALDYRLCSGGTHVRYSDVKMRLERNGYPYDIEHKLFNHITARNDENCMAQLREFSEFLSDPAYRIPDATYRAYYMQLCADIQRHAYVTFGIGLPTPAISTEEADGNHMFRVASEFVTSIVRQSMKLEDGRSVEDEVMHYIDDHLTDPNLNLNSVADTFDAHRNHVSRIVHKASGSHFTEYLHQQRVRHAKALMEDSDLTVSEASEASGFSYAHHFIRVFKSLEGITPGQYRKNVTERNRSAAR